MIKFIIDKVQLRNVRNYGDEIMEMDFPLDNLTVFTGHVGAGKSTILKAVSMALYGDDGGVKGEKLSIDDMVNERTGKNLEIHLFFRSIDDLHDNHEDKYEIHLYHKHSKMNNKLVFMKNGVDISANGKMDTYRLIEKTTIPKQVYHNIYYFTQQAKNFFTALPNGEQKEIFDSILDLGDYDVYYANCRAHITEYERKIAEIDVKIKMLESGINDKDMMLKNETENLKSLVEKNKVEISELEKMIQDIQNKYDDQKAGMILERSSDEIKTEITNIKHDIDIKRTNLDNEIQNLQKELTQIKEKYERQFNDEKVKVKEELDKINNPIKDEIQNLTLQKQKVEHDKDQRLSNSNSEYSKKQKEIEDRFTQQERQLSDSINDYKSQLLKYQDEVKTEYYKKQEEINKSISEFNDKRSELKSQQVTITSEIFTREDLIKGKQKQYDANDKQLHSETPHCDKCGQPLINLDKLKKEQEILTDDIDKLNKQLTEYETKLSKNADATNKVKENIVAKNEELLKIKETFRAEYDKKKEEFEHNIKLKQEAIDVERGRRNKDLSDAKDSYDKEVETIETEFKGLIDKISNDITSKNESIEYNVNEAKNKLIKLSQELKVKIQQESDVLNKTISEKNQERSNLSVSCDSKIDNLNLQLRKIEETENQLEELKFQIQQKQSELKVKKEFKVSDETLKSITVSLENDKKSLEESKKVKKDLDKTLEILEFWKSAFSDSGIKSMLIDVAIPHMNQCVREELDRVCPGTFTVSFDTLSETKSGNIRDKFSINIIHNIKCATGHKKLSGGEKRIIDFCCMSALRSLAEKLYGKMFGHIFYDEVLDSLDSESRELFCRSMKNQSNDHRNITMVTHALTEDVDPDRVFPF